MFLPSWNVCQLDSCVLDHQIVVCCIPACLASAAVADIIACHTLVAVTIFTVRVTASICTVSHKRAKVGSFAMLLHDDKGFFWVFTLVECALCSIWVMKLGT